MTELSLTECHACRGLFRDGVLQNADGQELCPNCLAASQPAASGAARWLIVTAILTTGAVAGAGIYANIDKMRPTPSVEPFSTVQQKNVTQAKVDRAQETAANDDTTEPLQTLAEHQGDDDIAWTKDESFSGVSHDDYRTERYSGPIAFPTFRGDQKRFAMFRTRLMEGAKLGADFAGPFTIVQIGCGAQCTFVYVIDLKTGFVAPGPFGSDEMPNLELAYWADSRLLLARYWSWGDKPGAPERCFYESYVWDGSKFDQLTFKNKPIPGDQIGCDPE